MEKKNNRKKGHILILKVKLQQAYQQIKGNDTLHAFSIVYVLVTVSSCNPFSTTPSFLLIFLSSCATSYTIYI